MKQSLALLAFIVMSISCPAQAIYGTFQGEIEGVSPFVIHLKGQGGAVEGFYKPLAGSVTVALCGSLDDAGNLLLKGTQSPYPEFTGKLTGKVIEGSVALLRGKKTHTFYAVDFRGEYKNPSHYDYVRLTLSESGYVFESLSRVRTREEISTFRDKDGRLWLRADSLNILMYIEGDALVLDTLQGKPAFLSPGNVYGAGELSFTISDGLWDGESFNEFPEKNEELRPEGFQKVLNDMISIQITQIPRSEYIVGKWILDG